MPSTKNLLAAYRANRPGQTTRTQLTKIHGRFQAQNAPLGSASSLPGCLDNAAHERLKDVEESSAHQSGGQFSTRQSLVASRKPLAPTVSRAELITQLEGQTTLKSELTNEKSISPEKDKIKVKD